MDRAEVDVGNPTCRQSTCRSTCQRVRIQNIAGNGSAGLVAIRIVKAD